MDVDDVLERMTKSIELINQHSKKNILLTVSPIPLEATFTSNNAILANTYSKSTLRIVAEKLKEKFDNVDYFPSFEIALSGGINNFKFDNVHIEYDMVKIITTHMINNYYSKNHLDINQTFTKNYIDDEFNV
jgi:arginyl-tRNA synthetase